MYTISVKLEGEERRKKNSAVMHVLLGFFLIVKAVDFLKETDFKSIASSVPIFAMGIAALVYGLLRKNLDPHARYNMTMRLLQIVVLVALTVMMVMIGRKGDALVVGLFVLVSAMLAASDKLAFAESSLNFDNEGIRLPVQARRALIPWNELNEVVIREDFVTLFHIKKKYLQFQVKQDLSTLEIAKISAFCNERLAKAPASQNS